MHDLNEGMSLQTLVKVLNAFDQGDMFRVYFDKVTWKFYILHNSELKLLIPQDTVLISSGNPLDFYNAISRTLSMTRLLNV